MIYYVYKYVFRGNLMSVHKLIETRLSNLNDNGNTIKAYFDIIHDDDKALL